MIRNLRELYQYRALLWSLTLRELKARYRGSVLGFFWTFLNPTLHMAVYALMLKMVLKQDIPNYAYFLFIGLLPWICISSSLVGGASAISDRRDLLTKVRFPAQVLPATVVLTNLVNYGLSLPLMVGLGFIYGVTPTYHALLFFPIVAIQTLLTLAVSYLLAALNVAFRDLQHIVSNLLMMGFFLTPVLWPVTNLEPAQQQLVLYANPFAAIVNGYRAIFYQHTLPDPGPLLAVAGLSILMLWMSSLIFERRREEFAEQI